MNPFRLLSRLPVEVLSAQPLMNLPMPPTQALLDAYARTGRRSLTIGLVALTVFVPIAAAACLHRLTVLPIGVVLAMMLGSMGIAILALMLGATLKQACTPLRGAGCQRLLNLCRDHQEVATYCQTVRDQARAVCRRDLDLAVRFQRGQALRDAKAACRVLNGIETAGSTPV